MQAFRAAALVGFDCTREDNILRLGRIAPQVANSMEHSTEVGVTHDRAEFNANVSMQDLVSDYLVPFQSCIEKVQGSGLMCSYSACFADEVISQHICTLTKA